MICVIYSLVISDCGLQRFLFEKNNGMKDGNFGMANTAFPIAK